MSYLDVSVVSREYDPLESYNFDKCFMAMQVARINHDLFYCQGS